MDDSISTATPLREPRPTERPAFPGQRSLLAWIWSARALLAAGALGALAFGYLPPPHDPVIPVLALAASLVSAAIGGWWLRRHPGQPGLDFIYLQAAADLGLTAALIYLAGVQSVFPALYVLVITAYAVLLPARESLWLSLLATISYAVLVFVVQDGRLDATLWAQLLVFNVVFVVVAVLGERLRLAGRERATLETELERVRLEADDILRNIRSGVMTVDGRGRLAYINPTAAQLLRLDEGQWVGAPVLGVLADRAPELARAIEAGITRGRKVGRGEGVVRNTEGRMFPIGLSTTAFRRGADEAPSVTAIFTDMSEVKQLQELNTRAERLEAVAQLSASLAHEIRNPLASIRSSVEQLARGAKAGDDEQVLARLVMRESDRLTRLLGEFLDFSRVRAAQSEPFDVTVTAQAAVALVRGHPDCRDDARLTVEGPPTILVGDEDLLHRIVSNLCLNAVQAATGPVEVTVRISTMPASEIAFGAELDQAVRIEVSDNGPGVPEEIRGQLFEPFVSGRPGGSGLGLAIVQRAVVAHRGLVLVDSVPGEGTTFTIFLPAPRAVESHA